MSRSLGPSVATRIRCAARAAWACLRGDQLVQRVPLDPAVRRPMCATLADCVKTCHRVEQAEAALADARRRLHPSWRDEESTS